MGKIRVYELAKELDMESKDVIRRLGKMGAEVKNHMSTVEDKYVQMLRDIMRPKLILEQKSAEHPSKPEHTESAVKNHTAAPEKTKPQGRAWCGRRKARPLPPAGCPTKRTPRAGRGRRPVRPVRGKVVRSPFGPCRCPLMSVISSYR